MKSATFRGLRALLWPRSTSSGNADGGGPKQLRPTAYLDGLRGFAAFLVYIHHHELWAHQRMHIYENAFGYGGEHHLVAFPFLRIFFTGGNMAVAVFYVISGYVLSVKPLSLIHAGEHLKLFDNLASAVFRRWFRLYAPLVVTTLAFALSWHVFGVYSALLDPKASVVDEVWNWYVEFKNFSFLYSEGWTFITYNKHLWSIPLEMRGSLVTYMACMALARATPRARLLCLAGLVYYFLYVVDGYYCALFMIGMLLCDLDLLARRRREAGGYFPQWLRRLEPYQTPICYAALLAGLYLGGVPSESQDLAKLRANPGWYWLSFFKPQAVFDFKWFFLTLSGGLVVASAARIAWLRRFFETRFCQFLGRVSFALYLVHGPILHIVGDRMYYAVGWVRNKGDTDAAVAAWADVFKLPRIGPLGLEVSFLLPNLVLLPLTLWTAEFVTRTVDEPSVRFAQWLYKLVQGGAGGGGGAAGAGEAKPLELAPLSRVE